MGCITHQFLLLLEFQEKVGRDRGFRPWVFAFFSRGILGKDDSPVGRYLFL